MTGTIGTRTGQVGLLSQRQRRESLGQMGHTPLGVSHCPSNDVRFFDLEGEACG